MKTKTQLELIMSAIVTVMIFGTLAYHNLEGWGYVDSFYFTGVTVTTIGYGDLHPTTAISKIFTVFFAFGGVGIMLFALSVFATTYFERHEKMFGTSLERKFISDIRKSFDEKHIRRKKRAIVNGSKL